MPPQRLFACLNVHQFASLAEAQAIIDAWRLDCNQRRPHSSLGHLTPDEFVGPCQVIQTVEEAVRSGQELPRRMGPTSPITPPCLLLAATQGISAGLFRHCHVINIITRIGPRGGRVSAQAQW